MTPQEIAESNTILRALVGSNVHGTSVGSSDRDEMGVCIEPPNYVIGLDTFEQAIIRDQPEGVRSQPGDTDLTVYSLRKWCRLALGGNPSALVLLFVPKFAIVTRTHLGQELQDLAWAFASKRAGQAFLGYLQAQRMRLTGERGQLRVTRTELIDKYGYDTKYAGHMIRLGFQGIEYMNTGRLTLPMYTRQAERVLAVRRGEVELNDVLTECGELEAEIKDLLETSPLPAEPHREAINQWLVNAYLRHWREHEH